MGEDIFHVNKIANSIHLLYSFNSLDVGASKNKEQHNSVKKTRIYVMNFNWNTDYGINIFFSQNGRNHWFYFHVINMSLDLMRKV